MTKPLIVHSQYDIAARRISGTRAEKLEQIDDAIQELLDIKVLECAEDRPDVRFVAVARRSHWFGMTVTLLALLGLLLLLGVRATHSATLPPAVVAPHQTSGHVGLVGGIRRGTASSAWTSC